MLCIFLFILYCYYDYYYSNNYLNFLPSFGDLNFVVLCSLCL